MLSNFTPARAVLLEELHDVEVFLDRPLLLDDVRVEVMVPALAALLADAAREGLGNLRPVFGTELKNYCCQLIIFLF